MTATYTFNELMERILFSKDKEEIVLLAQLISEERKLYALNQLYSLSELLNFKRLKLKGY
jgi:hypothetical protein